MRRAIARGRVFPQSYSTDRRYGRLSLKAIALFPLMWANADDQGRLPGDPDEIKYATCPNIDHITKTDIPELLEELAKNDLIKVYTTSKTEAIQILDWWDVHRPQWAWPSQYPPPEGWQDHLRYKRGAKEVVTQSWPVSSESEGDKPVYFILDDEAKAVKIGVADSPPARLANLQTANPHKLTLIKVVEGGGYKLEQTLHRLFAGSALGNEWFQMTKEIEDYLYSSGESSGEGSGESSGEQSQNPLTTPIKKERGKKKEETERGRGNSPESSGEGSGEGSGEKPTPSPVTTALLDNFPKAFGRKPNSRELAYLRDIEKEISAAGATVEQVRDAFKEAAKQNKLHLSYVRAVLLDWLGIERNRSP